MDVYDPTGKRYSLAATSSAGGEGTIYRVTGAPQLAAKIFHPARMTRELSWKLQVMTRSAPQDPSFDARGHRSVVWPLGLAYSDPGAQQIVGYVMPWIDTQVFKEAHTYYDPSDRIRRFGGLYTWRHLMIAASNLSSAVAAVHAQGHRIGDLRDTNILVAPNSLLSIIDCDSFQIVDSSSGQVFPTRVGAGEFLPPELQGADLAADGIDRYASDLFALGVLVFKFLMLGAHPHQARGGGVAGLPSIESKIKAGVYAFGGRNKALHHPEFAPPIGVLPPSLERLARRAFVDGRSRPAVRPSAEEWFDALNSEGQRLKICKGNANHHFGGHLRSCPWCSMSSDPFPAAPNLGGQVAAPVPNGAASIADRSLHLSSYIEMALVDGELSEQELHHIRRLGENLGLRKSEVDRLIQQGESKMKPSRESKPMRTKAVKTSPSPASAPRPSRSLAELEELLADYGRSGALNRWRPGVRATIRPAFLALVALAMGSMLPVLMGLLVTFVALPGLACASEVSKALGQGRGRARVASQMLTRMPQLVVQSVYYLVPVVIYCALGFGLAYVALVRVGAFDPDTVARWLIAVTSATSIVWVLLFAPKEPFVRSVSAGADLLEMAIAKTTRGRWAGPIILACVFGACLYLGIIGKSTWWPMQSSPF